MATRLFHNWPAKVLSFGAAVLLLIVHDVTRLEERFLTVPLELVLHDSLVPGTSYPQQVRVRIRGESDDVFGILDEDIRAYVDLSRHQAEGEYRGFVMIRRSGTAAEAGTLEITVEPESISLVLEEKVRKSVEVVANTSGFTPSGYELGQMLTTPSSVEIEGPSSRVEGLTEVRTEDIDISDKREDFTERLRLVRPDPLVRFPGGDIVEVRGIVEESVVLTTFEDIDVVVTGLDSAFRLGQELPQGLIRVQARQLDIENVDAARVQLLIDATGVEQVGTVRLPVRPVVPPGFVVLRYEPTSLVLFVQESPR